MRALAVLITVLASLALPAASTASPAHRHHAKPAHHAGIHHARAHRGARGHRATSEACDASARMVEDNTTGDGDEEQVWVFTECPDEPEPANAVQFADTEPDAVTEVDPATPAEAEEEAKEKAAAPVESSLQR